MKVFTKYGKTPRLNANVTITEKLDGTNASIIIRAYEQFVIDGVCQLTPELQTSCTCDATGDNLMWAASRNRILTPQNDNYGFARWVFDNAIGLFKLGEGQHYGEWWGKKIQRGYGLNRKVFSLFNYNRYEESLLNETFPHVPGLDVCNPIYQGPFEQEELDSIIEGLEIGGSLAAPGFGRPEGVIVSFDKWPIKFKVYTKFEK